jgi:hypothetical protein
VPLCFFDIQTQIIYFHIMRFLGAVSRRALAGAAAGAASGALAFGVLPPVDALLETPTDMLNDPPRVHWSSGNIPTVANGGVNRPKTIAEASEDLSKARKRIAIFGGSFNPITNAHLNCAAEISAPLPTCYSCAPAVVPHPARVRARVAPRSPLEAG